MQDQYAGDIGDFGKFGLLRWLSGMRQVDDYPSLRLGVNWHLVPNSGAGGGFIQYLWDPATAERTLKDCDPELFRLIRTVAKAKRRCVADIQRSGILPSGTLYYPDLPNPYRPRYLEYLTFKNIPSGERPDARSKWVHLGLAALADAEVIFLDPDNGLEVPSTDRHNLRGPKYAYYDDLQSYWKRGQSLVIYQNAILIRPVDALAKQRCEELRSKLPGARLYALCFNRRIIRIFLVAAQPKHASIIGTRVNSFLQSCWGKGANPHFVQTPCQP